MSARKMGDGDTHCLTFTLGTLPSSPSIAWYYVDAVDQVALGEFPGERMFTATVADQQYS